MPISKAAKKAERQNITRRAHNLKIKKVLKETIKTASAKNLNKVFSIIDKACKSHIIHKNKAAHLKSRLSKQFGREKNTSTKKNQDGEEQKQTITRI